MRRLWIRKISQRFYFRECEVSWKKKLAKWPNHSIVYWYYTIFDLNEEDMRIYLPEKVIFIEAARPRWISLLRVDKSSCISKLKSITVLLYDLWTKATYFHLCCWSHVQPKDFLTSFSNCYLTFNVAVCILNCKPIRYGRFVQIQMTKGTTDVKETKSATMNIFRFFLIFFLNHL